MNAQYLCNRPLCYSKVDVLNCNLPMMNRRPVLHEACVHVKTKSDKSHSAEKNIKVSKKRKNLNCLYGPLVFNPLRCVSRRQNDNVSTLAIGKEIMVLDTLWSWCQIQLKHLQHPALQYLASLQYKNRLLSSLHYFYHSSVSICKQPKSAE